MANLSETENYEDGVYQLELTDPVVGGPGGIANRQAEQLANRTAWLKKEIADALDALNAANTAIGDLAVADISGLQAALTALDNDIGGKEPAFAKNSAFNKNFGTGNAEVARGNHGHNKVGGLESYRIVLAPQTVFSIDVGLWGGCIVLVRNHNISGLFGLNFISFGYFGIDNLANHVFLNGDIQALVEGDSVDIGGGMTASRDYPSDISSKGTVFRVDEHVGLIHSGSGSLEFSIAVL